jgi:hypothetical protein
MLRDCPGTVTPKRRHNSGNVDLGVSPSLRKRISLTALRDPAMMRAIATEWPRLLAMLDTLAEHYDADVPIIDFIPILQSVMRLTLNGVDFDDAFLARLDELQASIVGSDEDGDADSSDSRLDVDESHDDYGTDPAREYAVYVPVVSLEDGTIWISSDAILTKKLRAQFSDEHGRPPMRGAEFDLWLHRRARAL